MKIRANVSLFEQKKREMPYTNEKKSFTMKLWQRAFSR